ncbi:CZB domain-containing protein [Thiothrix eikelboomii]|uniref:CZB domain-containing protein n=1 Tax=Thiothrix eikelboomii TaxID=92487 RepID=UPI003BAEE7F6
MNKPAFFLQRMNDHVQYLSKIKATLNKRGNFQGTDCHHCALGKWLYGEGPREVQALGADVHNLFEQLFEPHEKFHEASARALAHFKTGDELGQYRAMTEMHQLSSYLIKTLLDLDRTVAKHAQRA